jgi:hypothetical protein
MYKQRPLHVVCFAVAKYYVQMTMDCFHCSRRRVGAKDTHKIALGVFQKIRYETELKFQVEVFWVVTPCIMVATNISEVHAFFHLSSCTPGLYLCHFPLSSVTSTWRWRQHGPLKRLYPITTQHGVTTQKTFDLKHHRREGLKSRTVRVLPWRWRQHGPPKHWYPTTTTTRRHNSEDLDLNIHRRRNLKYRT